MSEIKDKKIAVYYIHTDRDLWQNEVKEKRYVHGVNNLWAYVRELSEREKFAAQASGAEQSTVFKVCHNKKIKADMYLEFGGETYKINSVDGREFYKRDLIIRAVRCVVEATDEAKYDDEY